MVLRIARKEFTDMLRDGRFRWATGLLLALLTVATVTGVRSVHDVAREHDAAADAMRGFWVAQSARNPHSAAHYGLWVFKPRMTLASLDQGVDPFTGVSTWLEAHRQNEFTRRPASDQAAVARFGAWSAAAILQGLVPLVIIMLAFPAFAGERERGTLRQLLAIGVPTGTLLRGKALGVAGAMALVLVPATLLGVAALGVGPGRGADDVLRYGLLVAAYLTYFAVVLAVSLAVSAWAPTMRVAVLVLLALWTANVLVAPRAVADLARRVHPTPSAFEFQEAVATGLRGGIDGHDSADERRKAVEERALAEYRVVSLDALPVNFDAIAMQASEEHGNAVFDEQFGVLYDAYRAQNGLAQLAGALAPVLAVRSLSMALAGTDVEQHRHFAVEAESYRRGLMQWLNAVQRDNSLTGDWDWKADADTWSKYPPFTYEAPAAAAMLAHQGRAIAVLGGWLLVAVALLLRAPAPRLS